MYVRKPRYNALGLFIVESIVLGASYGDVGKQLALTESQVSHRYRQTRKYLIRSNLICGVLPGMKQDRKNAKEWIIAVNKGRTVLNNYERNNNGHTSN